jgi:hypothetical protein
MYINIGETAFFREATAKERKANKASHNHGNARIY